MLTPIGEPTGLMKSLDERFPYPGKQLLRDSVRSMPFARSVLRLVEDTAFAWMNHPRGIYAYLSLHSGYRRSMKQAGENPDQDS